MLEATQPRIHDRLAKRSVFLLGHLAAFALLGGQSALALNCKYVPKLDGAPDALCMGTDTTVRVSISPFASEDVPVKLKITRPSGHPGIAKLVISGTETEEGNVTIQSGATSTTVTLRAVAATDCTSPITLTASTCSEKSTHPSVTKQFFISDPMDAQWVQDTTILDGTVLPYEDVVLFPGGFISAVMLIHEGSLGGVVGTLKTEVCSYTDDVNYAIASLVTLESGKKTMRWDYKDTCGRISPCPATSRVFNYGVELSGRSRAQGDATGRFFPPVNGQSDGAVALNCTTVLKGNNIHHQITPPSLELNTTGHAQEVTPGFTWKVSDRGVELSSGFGYTVLFDSGLIPAERTFAGDVSGGGEMRTVTCEIIMHGQASSVVDGGADLASCESKITVINPTFE